MIARRGAIGVLASTGAAILAGCGLLGGPSNELKFRLKLLVDTPDGVRAGSSVLLLRLRKASSVLRPIDVGSSTLLGQAPYVDLGNGRYLFATLNDPLYRRNLVETVTHFMGYPDLQPPLSRQYSAADWPQAFSEMQRVKPFAPLRPDDYPMLVTFGDVRNPATVTEVQPEASSAVLGSLQAIILEIVDRGEELTSDFEAKFPEIANAPGSLGDVPRHAARDQFLDKQLRSNCFVKRST